MSALSLPPGPGPGSDVGTKGSADLAAENARLRQQLDAVTKERARHKTDNERLARRLAVRFEQTEKARAEVEWMRPVVEAALAWLDYEPPLYDVVVAYRAAQVDQRGPSDGLSASVGDEQASLVANLAMPDLTDEERSAFVAAAEDKPAPADPAGLDAAIEAVMPMLLRWLDDEVSSGDTRNLAKAVIQDAAPHIRRAVLLEAADETAKEAARFRKLGKGMLSPELYNAAANALERNVDRLRERAEREVPGE